MLNKNTIIPGRLLLRRRPCIFKDIGGRKLWDRNVLDLPDEAVGQKDQVV